MYESMMTEIKRRVELLKDYQSDVEQEPSVMITNDGILLPGQRI